MNPSLTILLLFSTLIFSSCSSVSLSFDCVKSENTQKGNLIFVRDFIDNEENFRFDFQGVSYFIDIRGNGFRKLENNQIQNFEIPVDHDYVLETVFLLEYENDLVIVYSQGAAGEGTGKVVRLNSENLEILWDVWAPGLNMGYPVIEDNYLYLSAYSMVLGYELDKGSVVWQHDSLKYNTRYFIFTGEQFFNSFEAPQVCDDKVVFTARKLYQNDKIVPGVIVNKESGLKKIISAN